jgi:hypothetical protein
MNFSTESRNLFFAVLPWMWIPLCILTGISRFDTNDDGIMLLTAAQGNSSVASEQLVFISVWIGHLLKLAYTVGTTVPWYPTLMASFQAASFSNLLILLNSKQLRSQNYFDNYAFNLIFLCLAGLFFINLQFTHVAILCGASGAIGILLHTKLPNIIFSVLLLFFGFSTRIDGASLGVITVGLTIPFLLMRTEVIYLKRIIFLLLLSAFFYYANDVMWSAYSPFVSADTREYILFNQVRGRLDGLGGYPDSAAAQSAAASVSLSTNDWNLFKAWYFADAKLFSYENLKIIADLRPPLSLGDFFSAMAFESYVRSLLYEKKLFIISLLCYVLSMSRVFEIKRKGGLISAYSMYVLMAVLFIIIILLYTPLYANIFLVKVLACMAIVFISSTQYSIKINTNFDKQIISFFIISNLLLYNIFVLGRLPDRVLDPTGFIFLTLFIIVCRLGERENSYANKNSVTSEVNQIDFVKNVHGLQIVAVNLMIALGIIVFLIHNIVVNKHRTQSSLAEWHPDRPIIAFPSFYTPMLDFDPYANIRRAVPNWDFLIPLGTSIRSPSVTAKTEELGIDLGLLPSVLNGNAYLGVGKAFEAELVYNYYCEHHKIKVIWETIVVDSKYPDLKVLMPRHEGNC